MNTNDIKAKLQDGKIDEAIKGLLILVKSKSYEYLSNEVISISYQYRSLKLEALKGVVSDNDKSVGFNRIVNSILEMISEIDNTTPGDLVSNKDLNVINTQNEELLRIYRINLESAELAVAKWGELAPPILLHRIEDAKQKIEELTKSK